MQVFLNYGWLDESVIDGKAFSEIAAFEWVGDDKTKP